MRRDLGNITRQKELAGGLCESISGVVVSADESNEMFDKPNLEIQILRSPIQSTWQHPLRPGLRLSLLSLIFLLLIIIKANLIKGSFSHHDLNIWFAGVSNAPNNDFLLRDTHLTVIIMPLNIN